MSLNYIMKNKNLIITGVNGGMGKATAEKFISLGFHVFGLDIQNESIVKEVDYYQCDITDDNRIKEIFNDIKLKVDVIDTVISLAGIYAMDSLLEIENERLKKIIDINSLGAYRLVKNFMPLLKKGSKIIITSSEVAPLDPLPFNGVYSISKSLLEKYAFSLRMELDLFGIDVVLFRPGAVKTNLLGDSMSELNKMCDKTIIHKDTSKRFKKIVESVESKHVSPEKVANKIYKIDKKKHPKYVYKLNNNFLLKLLNILPDRWQVKIIGKILKTK